MNGLVLITALGVLCTKTVDILKHAIPRKIPPALSVLLSIIVGLAYAFIFQIDVFAALKIEVAEAVSPTAIRCVSGFLIGGMGSGVYELLDIVSTQTSAIKTKAGVRRGR